MLTPEALREWVEGSGVDEAIVRLNVESIGGQAPYERLFYSDQIKRLNAGRLPSGLLKKYSHIEQGGWWVNGIDPLTGEDELWGCFKPDHPRIDATKGKHQKYEHPFKAPATLFALRVPLHSWEMISKRYGVPMPDNVVVDVEGEALGFWDWVIANPRVSIVPAEGAKKAGALLSQGFAAIGLPGIWGGYRKNEGKPCLLPQLEVFAQEGRHFYFAFDQDEKAKTRHANRKALWCTAKLLLEKGCQASIISWEPWIKGCDDLIVAKGREHFIACYEKAISFEDWQAERLSELNYKPALRLDPRTKYMGEFSPPPGAKLIGLKAPKGSGKTELLVRICVDAQNRGQKVIVITHREQLGKALCSRFGIDYVTELKDSDTKGCFGFGLCFDSLRQNSRARFDPEDWHDCIVILDECEQSIWHLLNAKTEVAKHRVQILRNFQQLIQNVVESEDGRIYLSDADLSDLSLDFIRSLASFPVEPWIVVKEGNPTPWNVTVWQDSKEMLGVLESRIRRGEKPLIFVDGQKVRSMWGTKNLEAYLSKEFPELRILRIDAESVSTPGHAAYDCIDKLNEILSLYDLVIASPSIETGVSIDIKGHFTSVWDFAQGVIPVSSVLQRMARLREPVPRHVWAKSYGLGRIGNGSTSPKRLMAGQDTKFNAHIKQLAESEFVVDFDSASRFQPQSLRTWAKMGCRINLGMVRYQHEIIRALVAEGHTISTGDYLAEMAEDDQMKGTEQVKEELTETRDENYQQYLTAITQAPNPDSDRLKILQEKKAKSISERLEQRKGELSERYDESLVSSELVELDDKGEFPKAQLHYYLMEGQEFLGDREKSRMEKLLEAGENELFIPDANRSMIGGKLAYLKALGIPELFNKNVEWCNDSQTLIDLRDKTERFATSIKDVLGISFNFNLRGRDGKPRPPSPVSIAQKYLRECFDLKFSDPIKRGAKGNQQRFYQPVEVPELRQKILSVWRSRDEKQRAAKLAESKLTSQCDNRGLEVVPFDENNVTVGSTGNYIYINSAGYQDAGYQDAAYQNAAYRGEEPVEASACQVSSIEALVAALASCKSAEDFAALIEGFSGEAIEDAISLQDTQPKRQQLTKLYEAIAIRPSLEEYQPGQQVWAYFPQSCDGWLRGVVEWIRGNTVRVKSGFLGTLISAPDAIAPGDWELSG
jgi:molybdopterin-guanine dinucleotide biosynthesis protein